MAKYIVLEPSFIDGKLVKEGEEIEFNGVPGRNLKPLDGAAKKAVPSVPPLVASLISAARINAAARGASPDEANSGDVAAVVSEVKPQPSQEVINEALAIMKLDQQLA